MSLCESLLLCPAPIVTRCLEGTRCRKQKGQFLDLIWSALAKVY